MSFLKITFTVIILFVLHGCNNGISKDKLKIINTDTSTIVYGKLTKADAG